MGEERGICVLRLLRRQFPDHAETLARRMAPPTRQVEARMAILRRQGAALAREVTVQNLILPRGTPVDDFGQTCGIVLVSLGAQDLAVEVPLSDLRALSPRDRERNAARQFDRGQTDRGPIALQAEDDSPSP